MKNKLVKFLSRNRVCIITLSVFILTTVMCIVYESSNKKKNLNNTEISSVISKEIEGSTLPENTSTSSLVESKTETVEVTYYDVPVSEEDQDFIKEVCSEYEILEDIIYKIMYVESGYNPNAISETNDHGIMQLNLAWVDSYLEQEDKFSYLYVDGFDIYNIKHNVLIAIRELAYWKNICYNRGYDSYVSILECYNRGFNYFKNTSYKNYSTKVLSQEIETYVVEKAVV